MRPVLCAGAAIVVQPNGVHQNLDRPQERILPFVHCLALVLVDLINCLTEHVANHRHSLSRLKKSWRADDRVGFGHTRVAAGPPAVLAVCRDSGRFGRSRLDFIENGQSAFSEPAIPFIEF